MTHEKQKWVASGWKRLTLSRKQFMGGENASWEVKIAHNGPRTGNERKNGRLGKDEGENG
jgi:hypothetical protein